eukprot:m.456945 g.456945  ORF g.456945 m.456945 type:complete len:52 (+) comp20327_c9_seq1:336-491(+)
MQQRHRLSLWELIEITLAVVSLLHVCCLCFFFVAAAAMVAFALQQRFLLHF